MGQKVHPYGFRIGINKTWRSRWYAGNNFPALLEEDHLVRRYLHARLAHARGRVRTVDNVRLHPSRRVSHAGQRIVIEITLLHRAVPLRGGGDAGLRPLQSPAFERR